MIKYFLAYTTGILFLGMLTSCSVGPVEIDYGHDQCQYCRMTIVDARYGSELVTPTGKAHKFDAVECLIRFIDENKIEIGNDHLVLVTDYSNPGQLVDAKISYFLRSGQLTSPMGLFITGFADGEKAQDFQQEFPGRIYDWDELNSNFKDLPNLAQEQP